MITTCTQPGTLALTFDDGPYIYTSQLLDTLDSLSVKATFFVTGNNLGKKRIDDETTAWPGILRRIYASGHHIASHSWTHRNLDEVNSTIQHTEIIYNEMAFRNLFGWIPTYWRPPYLECSTNTGCLGLLGNLGYHVVSMNLDTKDYENDSPTAIQTSKDRFSGGVSANAATNEYIELSHDIHYQTVVNLTAYMVSIAKARGYRLVTVGECLGDPSSNWYRQAGSGTSSTDIGSPSVSASKPASTTSITVRDATTKPPTSTTKPSTSTTTISPTSSLIISRNQLCGGTTGYTCLGSAFGNCCSFYGYW
jgi:peptidoglycan/xylan/chitin deacetylase (PgdA/CDA1 family)